MRILEEEFLKKLDAFSLAMRAYARGGAGGLRRSRALGSSVEFSDYRTYAPGDDPRRVDWNAYARFDRLFLKLFLEEQETMLRILLDASGSMGFGGDKWRLALRTAAALAYLALTRYDRVAVVALSEGQALHGPTFTGRAAFPAVEQHLLSLRPSGQAKLEHALLRVPLSAGRGVCALLSDLLDDTDWSRGADSLLYRRQELSVLHILSPEELSPGLSGAVRLLDTEGGPSCDVQSTSEVLRRYEETLSSFLREQQSFCHRRALPYLLLRADMDFERDALSALAQGGVIASR